MTQYEILQLLKSVKKPLLVREIAAELGVNQSSANRCMQKLWKYEKRIRRKKFVMETGGRGYQYYYKETDNMGDVEEIRTKYGGWPNYGDHRNPFRDDNNL